MSAKIRTPLIELKHVDRSFKKDGQELRVLQDAATLSFIAAGVRPGVIRKSSAIALGVSMLQRSRAGASDDQNPPA